MKKNTLKFKLIFSLVALAVLLGSLYFFAGKKRSVQLIGNSVQEKLIDKVADTKIEKVDEKTASAFLVTGWIPYWAKSAGVASLQGKMELFSQLNLFAFGVSADGQLVDTAKSKNAPWPQLFAEAKKQNVKIVPTILWGDAIAIHKTFSDPALRSKHADSIVAMLAQNDFRGVDIDYEGKDIADRDNFSLFLKSLHEKLQSSQGRTLNCTVEARTQDSPPADLTGIRAMSFANDFSALNHFCDSVTIMAYDQVFQIHRVKVFEDNGSAPAAPNADNAWVQDNIEYALKFIAPEKLILGVSTYGWEFRVEKIANGYHYTRVRSVSYQDAMALAASVGATPTRTTGGELSFAYKASDGQHLVTIDDGESVSDKIALAKKFGLKGISLFKIDGLTDPKVFEVLKVR